LSPLAVSLLSPHAASAIADVNASAATFMPRVLRTLNLLVVLGERSSR
jgi:hypothetical protein